MQNKTVEELVNLLLLPDFDEQWDALRKLEQHSIDVSAIPFLEQALFSNELANLDDSFRHQANETTDFREVTASAYGSYEIDTFRYRIIQLLTKIGTKSAFEIIDNWGKYERKADS